MTLDEAGARQAETYLSEVHFPPPAAVGLTERADGTWHVDAYFECAPDMDALLAGLRDFGLDFAKPELERLEDADWVARSQRGLHPVRAGRFLVHGSHDKRPARASRWAIEIDAGQAFGTAHHGSTLGCLYAINDLAKRGSFSNVLDIGTGSGVLAIAAAKVWRANVIATDIDPVSIKVARENCRINGVLGNVRASVAAGIDHPLVRAGAPYDLITANILAKPLTSMARAVATVVTPGGIIVLSGITREQAGRVAAAYGAAGFSRLRQITVSGWVTLTLVRAVRRP